MISDLLLQQLRSTFSVAFIGPNGEVQIACPFCVHRGMGADGSGKSAAGHLGLNFKKNVGFCVRCGAGLKNIHQWLARRNIETPYVASVIRANPREFWAERDALEKPPEYKQQRIELPRGCRFIQEDDVAATPFIQNMLDKRLTMEQVLNARIMYAVEGRLAGYCIFPVYEDDELVYWQARAVRDDLPPKKNPYKDEVEMGKSYWLYGVDDAVIGGSMTLVEGGLDRISAHDFVRREFGDQHYALGLLGTSVGHPKPDEHWLQSQLGKIIALEPSEICVLFDGPKHATDKGAYGKAALVAAELEECGLNAYAGKLDYGDPNEASDDLMRSAMQRSRTTFDIGVPSRL